MDTDDIPFLSYLSDKPQSLLLQNNDEALGVHLSGLNVEQMFTDMTDGSSSWAAIDGLPILMNNSFITEDQQVESCLERQDTNLSDIYRNSEASKPEGDTLEPIDDSTILTFPVDVPTKGVVTPSGLFLTNDVLFQLNLKENVQETEEIDQLSRDQLHAIDNLNNKQETLLTLRFTEEQSKATANNHVEELMESQTENAINLTGLNENNDVIQLLNSDGSIITISKHFLASPKEVEVSDKQQDISQLVQGMYQEIIAQKCSKCSHICESRLDMIKHILDSHIQQNLINNAKKNAEIKKKIVTIQKQSKGIGSDVPMKSLLNVNNKKLAQDCQTVYLCSVCSVTCSNTEELKDHMITVHKLIANGEPKMTNSTANNETKEGEKASVSKLLHKNLVQSQQKAKKIKCSIKGCVARFSQDAVRLRHEKCHVDGQKKQFKCTVCNKLFSIWRICSLHIWKCHKIDVGLLSCPMCNNYKSLSPHYLLNHMATHASDYPFVCSYCGKTFKQMSQLRNHQITHKEHKDDLPNWASQQKCDICGNYFSCSKSLKKHIQQVHNKFKPFICNICGHNTTRKAMLQLHLRQHTGEKPHKCTICQYSTGDHNSLRRHMMRHNGSAKYSCPHCDYKCIQSSSFKIHIAKKHPGMGGTYTCLLCSFKFVNEVAYNTHVQEHRKEKLAAEMNSKNMENLQQIANGNAFNQNVSAEDDETQNYFLHSDHTEDAVDTGGITIPAGSEINVQP